MAFIPTAPTLTVAGRVFVDTSSNLIIVYVQQTTAANFGTFRQANATSGYTPSAGKAFHAYAFVLQDQSGSPSLQAATLLTGTSDVGVNSASPPSSPEYFIGGSLVQAPFFSNGTNVAIPGQYAIDWVVANGTFPTINVTGTQQTLGILYGYEQ